MIFEDLDNINAISTRVSEIALHFPTSQCPEYQRTMDATDALLAAREVDGQARVERLQTALAAVEDATPEVPEEHHGDWQDCVDGLQEMIDDE